MINKNRPDSGFLEHFKLSELATHTALIAAANNASISTDALIQFALEGIRDEREGKEDVRNIALLLLQQRVTQEVFNTARDLCRQTDPAQRQLGAMILREFPGLDAEKPFKDDALHVLEEFVLNESDEEVLVWGLSAIGWQIDPQAVPLLLRFVDHPNARVRLVVANNLILSCKPDNPFPHEVAEAYKKLCVDSDEDIRWYSYATFSDIAEDAEWVFNQESQKQAFLALLLQGLEDGAPSVREQAQNAINFVNSKQNSPLHSEGKR